VCPKRFNIKLGPTTFPPPPRAFGFKRNRKASLMKASNITGAAGMVQKVCTDIHVSRPCLIQAGILFSTTQYF
jgi:hypothetical protein